MARAVSGRMALRGRFTDAQSRCAHWNGPTDIVAFRFACCDGWWPCSTCHAESAGHDAIVWPIARFSEPSVLCGACKSELTVPDYASCGSRCPHCGAAFNPKCKGHWGMYFEQPGCC